MARAEAKKIQAFHRLVLQTERLLLRPLAASDAGALFAIFSDRQVTRYWSSAAWDSQTTAEDYIAKDIKALRRGEHLRLGIEVRATTELVGMCTLYAFMNQCRRAEIEALLRLLDYGFAELDLHRVEADVDPRNLASVRCLDRLGFRKEGHLRERWIVDGEISDTSFYGLLHNDWRTRKKP